MRRIGQVKTYDEILSEIHRAINVEALATPEEVIDLLSQCHQAITRLRSDLRRCMEKEFKLL